MEHINSHGADCDTCLEVEKAFEAMRVALRRCQAILDSPEDGWGDEGEPTAQANEAMQATCAALAMADKVSGG